MGLLVVIRFSSLWHSYNFEEVNGISLLYIRDVSWYVTHHKVCSQSGWFLQSDIAFSGLDECMCLCSHAHSPSCPSVKSLHMQMKFSSYLIFMWPNNCLHWHEKEICLQATFANSEMFYYCTRFWDLLVTAVWLLSRQRANLLLDQPTVWWFSIGNGFPSATKQFSFFKAIFSGELCIGSWPREYSSVWVYRFVHSTPK